LPIAPGTLFVAHPLCRHNTCSWLAEPPCGSTATAPHTHRPHRRTRLSLLRWALASSLCRIRSAQVALSSPRQVRTGECTARHMLRNRNSAVWCCFSFVAAPVRLFSVALQRCDLPTCCGSHPTSPRCHPLQRGVKQTPLLRAHQREAPLAALSADMLRADYLPSTALQPTSVAQDRPSQLDFREQLMHELLEQLPADQKPQRASKRPNPADSLAKDHYLERAALRGDCVVCSSTSPKRVRPQFVCAECQAHLCVGACFASYHRKP
jgi:hypothetical protein